MPYSSYTLPMVVVVGGTPISFVRFVSDNSGFVSTLDDQCYWPLTRNEGHTTSMVYLNVVLTPDFSKLISRFFCAVLRSASSMKLINFFKRV